MSADVSAEVVARALRTIRPSMYRIDSDNGGTGITLVADVSAAGRRNAADRIVTALAGDGLAPVADDPIEALAAPGTRLVVRRTR